MVKIQVRFLIKLFVLTCGVQEEKKGGKTSRKVFPAWINLTWWGRKVLLFALCRILYFFFFFFTFVWFFSFLLSKFKFISYLFVIPPCLPFLHLPFSLLNFLFLSTLCSLSLFPNIYFVHIVIIEGACRWYQPASNDSIGAEKKGYAVSAPW